MSDEATVFTLHGLRADNLLGVLALIGALRGLDGAWGGRPAMAWWSAAAPWRASLQVPARLDAAALATLLHQRLAADQGAIESLADGDPRRTGYDPVSFRALSERAAAAALAGDRRLADHVAMVGSDACVSHSNRIRKTVYNALDNAQLRFAAILIELGRTITADDLAAALFAPWRRNHQRSGLRLDPAEEQSYALRAGNPSEAGVQVEGGACRLAVAALPWLPTMPARRDLLTTGCTRDRNRGDTVSWPIWTRPATAAAVQALLAHPALTMPAPDPAALAPLGVAEVIRARKVQLSGRLSNFTNGRPLWGAAAMGRRPAMGAGVAA